MATEAHLFSPEEALSLSYELTLIRAKLAKLRAGVLFDVLWKHRRKKDPPLTARELACEAGWFRPDENNTDTVLSGLNLIYKHIGTLRSELISHNNKPKRERSSVYRFEITLPDRPDGYKLEIKSAQSRAKQHVSSKHTKVPTLEVAPDTLGGRIINKKLLLDPLTGLAFAERWGIKEQLLMAFLHGRRRLIKHPEDVLFRAMFFWFVMVKGNPDQVIEVIQDTADYLHSDLAAGLDRSFEGIWHQKLNEMNFDEHPQFVRCYLEVALVRAVLLRWLKVQGKSSSLASRIRGISGTPGGPLAVRAIFELGKSQSEEDWLAIAIKEVHQWITFEPNSGLAQVCFLWLAGRQRNEKLMSSAVEQAFHWLELHPKTSDSFVRWGMMWLAGFLDRIQVDLVIEETSKWLRTGAIHYDTFGDPLVRISFLQLVGTHGTVGQVRRAIEENAKWLNEPRHRDYDCVLIAHLFFLIKRGKKRGVLTGKQDEKWLWQAVEWKDGHPNDELMIRAIRFFYAPSM